MRIVLRLYPTLRAGWHDLLQLLLHVDDFIPRLPTSPFLLYHLALKHILPYQLPLYLPNDTLATLQYDNSSDMAVGGLWVVQGVDPVGGCVGAVSQGGHHRYPHPALLLRLLRGRSSELFKVVKWPSAPTRRAHLLGKGQSVCRLTVPQSE